MKFSLPKTWKFNTFQHIQTVSTGDFRIPPASRPSLDSPDELRRVAAVLLEVPEANRPPRKWQAKLATAALLWWANPRDLRCQNVSMMSNRLYQAARSQVKLICQNLLQASPTCKPIDCTPPCTHWTVFHLESFSHLFTSLLKPDKCGPWSQEQTKQLQRSCLGKLDKTRHGTTWCNLGRSIQFLSKNDIHSQNTSFIEEMARYLSVFFSPNTIKRGKNGKHLSYIHDQVLMLDSEALEWLEHNCT